MKTSTFVTALFASGVLATPVVNNRGHYHAANYQRDVVTNVVHATKVLYQNQVVYVDDEGKPYSTGVEPASTTVKLSQATSVGGDKSEGNNNNEQQKQQPQSTTEVTTTAAVSTTAAPSSTGSSGQESPEAHQEAQQSIQNQHIAQQSSYIQQQNAGASAETSTPPTPSSSASSSASQPSASSGSGSSDSGSDDSDSGSDDSDSGSNSGTGEQMSGQATYYTPGLGACGDTSGDDDLIAALNKDQFYSGGDAGVSNGNSNCGRKAKVTRGSKHVTVTIVDSCPGCKKGDLDLSPAAFKKLASESEGRVEINWQWAD
ncbi:hypothetical protein TRICI_002699 [Trichomonascus ciferrii]|uniref:RlpA-like protein double-psi beta-barrel domain-containing protein n=1 Tax=Trichomonascus ciferrii TaxID=44093 RepID=A0A642V757_9ASCO|nr:hypothetical protein TRICI_002699 [Trichomonascus ciferrii]